MQVPGYLAQWRRTRDNLAWLLDVANEVVEDELQAAAAAAGANASSTSTSYYTLPELCYCYSLATSRCFHLPGRMLLAPWADLGNHQPLWQSTAYPFWEAAAAAGAAGTAEATAAAGAAAGATSGDGSSSSGTSGCFQWRAVRDLEPGTEVCICYAEEGNSDLLFSYGFIREVGLAVTCRTCDWRH